MSVSNEAIEALEAARAHILDAYRIWQADDVSAVPPPKSGAGAVIAKIDAVLASPIAGETKALAPVDIYLALEAWADNGHLDRDHMPEIAREIAALISSPGKDGGQEDDRTEGFIAGYDEGLRQSKNEASISTTDALEKAKAVLKTIRRGALAPMGDVIAALTALDNALEAAPSKETDQ